MNYRIFPLSECAVIIDFGNKISVELNQKVSRLAEFIESNKFPGFVENVPAYSSLTIFFDLLKVKKSCGQTEKAFSFVKNFLEKCLENDFKSELEKDSIVEIPVDYSSQFSPDLEYIADKAQITTDEVIRIYCKKVYRVFMIGFLPAFAYMGEVDERIAVPRKQVPRKVVPKGSVGIAGKQTGIYPLDSPGGWQIIGKTDLELFQPDENKISFLKTGDYVRFYDVHKK